MTTAYLLAKWTNNLLSSDWDVNIKENGPVSLISASQSSPYMGISLSRLCILKVPGKFFAETLLIYPQTDCFFPIFGSEYIKTSSRTFGATDFHPISPKNNSIPRIFDVFPDRQVEKSPHYNLNTYFSPKLWHKKEKEDFYEEFSTVCKTRLSYYLQVLSSIKAENSPTPEKFSYFDTYMATHDPAHGILKSYFGSGFADDYIKAFLFPNSRYINLV